MYDKKLKLSQEEKDNWLGLFPFSETNTISYNNLIEWNGKEYWKVDYANVFAVRKGDMLIPVGSHVILDAPLPEERQKVGKIELMNKVIRKMSKYQAESQVIAIADPLKGKKQLDTKPGDYVVYDARYGAFYEIWGRPVVIVRQEHLLAKLN
jgi:co-chaperonin GroES (HSP10)